MTGDRTQVDTTELTAFASGTRQRASDAREVATSAARITLGTEVLGAVNIPFTDDLRANLAALVATLSQQGADLDRDADDTAAAAEHFAEVNQAQVDRFTRIDDEL